MNIKKIRKAVLILLIGFTTTLIAQTQLPSFFSNNMVLQRNEGVSIWGQDSPNVEIEVSGSWGNKSYTKSNKEGFWKLKLQTPQAGGPYTVLINGSKQITLTNVLIGEVWLCSGQSNMAMPLKGLTNSPINGSNETILNSHNSQIRFFDTKKNTSLKPLNDVTGQWFLTDPSTVGDFSALAYYFGAKLQDVLNIPIGLIHTSWGGSTVEAWMDSQTIEKFEKIKIPNQIPETQENRSPTLLYNAMLNPFIPYSIRGFIWYQGEANTSNAKVYSKLFPAMIKSWRNKWGKNNLPFYFVQISPFDYRKYGEINSAFLRESQLQTMQIIENSGMVSTMDLGNCSDIHPAEKELIGNRLAYWALAKNYGIKGISYNGPLYKSMKSNSDGRRLILTFEFCPNGWSTFGQNLKGFKIAGKDKVFHDAQVKIHNNRTLIVWSELVKKPIAVRYAFDNCTKGTLFNTEGLPASSFRTDNWVE